MFAAPMVNPGLEERFGCALRRLAPDLPLRLVAGRSREVLAASDGVLTASGTATLEALLLKRPMVVGYRVHPLSYRLVKGLGLVKVPHVAMANLLAGEELAPELIQGRCRPDLLAPTLLQMLADARRVQRIQATYARIHQELRRGAADTAAAAVLELANGRRAAGGKTC